MPSDANITLAAQATVTATTNGSAVILAGGTPRRGLVARVIYSAALNTSASDTITFSLDVCYDGVPTTWYADFVAPTITLTTTAQSGEIFIPFSISPTSVANGTQVRLTCKFSADSTHGNTIKYGGDILASRP